MTPPRGGRARSARRVAGALALLLTTLPALSLLAPTSARADGTPSPPASASASAAPSDGAPPSEPPAEPDKDDSAARKAEARARFEKGRKLSSEGAWSAALAEYLASRELYPTSGNTLGAASSLRKLARFDEALDMFEILLRDHAASLDADVRGAAQREVVELRGLVGTVEIEGAEIGAAITVDGRSRGEYPAPSPLRVAAGTHVVRVSKEGFETFESRVDVAGNGTARVTAALRPLAAAGRLHVAERAGGALDVIVDGARVGRTPWEGTLAPGDHVVLLTGEGDLGTLPLPVAVKVNETTRLTLAAEPLRSSIRVEPEPVTASVAIDAVALGQGTWEGRLRAGKHKIEIAAPGFVTAVRDVQLATDERAVVRIPLARDEASPFWSKPPPPSHFLVEVSGAVPVVPSFGGDIAGGCAGECRATPGFGAYVAARGGYELSSGFGFGLAGAFLFAQQTVASRPAALAPVGLDGEAQGSLDHTLAIRRAFLVGPWLGFSFGDRFPVHLRVAGGAAFAWVGETRAGTFTPVREGPEYPVGPITVSTFAPFVHVSPDVRVGYRITKGFEVNVGVDALILIPLSKPAWDDRRPINAGVDGIGTFPAERFTGDLLLGIAPGVGARYDFF
ncbi:MAG: PEGA domain-containing protein [Polyangiaceae bacterium]